MRVPVAISLESRDGTVTKDAKIMNGVVETKGEQSAVRKRPGLSDAGLIRAGVAQALGYWNNSIVAIIADYLNIGVTYTYTHSTTWNPSDKDSDITLSNGNLTAQFVDPTSSSGAVRSIYNLATGLWYFEATVSGAYTSQLCGVCNSSKDLNQTPSTGTNAIMYSSVGSVLFNGGTVIGSLATWTSGKILGVLVDADLRTVKFYVNGVLQYTATSIPTGNLYAYFGGTAANGSSTILGNFGATSFTYTPNVTTAALSPTSAGLQFSMQDNGSNASAGSLLMLKNRDQAWYVNAAGTVTQITDVDYPGTYAVTLTSLTRSGTVATATTASDNNFQVGGTVVIAGATPSTYNGAQVITGITPSSDPTITTTPPEKVSVPITITRSGTTATAVCTSIPHGYTNGQVIYIEGANQSEYNGQKTVTWISGTSFSFTVTIAGEALVTPATGTITLSHYAPGNSINHSVTSAVLTMRFSVAHGWISGAATSLSFYYQTSTGVVTPFSGSGLSITRVDDTTITIPVAGVPDLSFNGGLQGPSAFQSTPQLSPAAIAVTSVTGDGQTATLTTTSPHGLALGSNTAFIGGALQSYYGGDKVVTVTGASTLTYSAVVAITNSPATPATGQITAFTYYGGGTVTTPNGASFTFTIAGSPATPATGTITATSGRNTVPGIAYMDGYFVVMDVNGVVYNSQLDTPSGWNALEYITAQAETGVGKHLTKSQSYIVAFKQWSTEFLYNAGNPVGSPFSPVPNAFTQIGCASGDSVAKVDGNLCWLSQTREKGRSVHVMNGMQQQKVSTTDVERILNADDLAEVYAYGIKLDGHSIYLLTLVTSDITLAYDMSSQSWGQWTSLTLGSSKSVSSITRTGTTATVVTATAHGLSDGDPVKISGAHQSGYNGIFQISYVDATTFTIEVTVSTAAVTSITRASSTATCTTTADHGYTDQQKVTISGATQTEYNGTYTVTVTGLATFTYTVSGTPATPATGTIVTNNPAETGSGTILAYPYTETYFKFTHYTNGGGTDYVLHKSDGHLYSVSSSVYQDNAIPVNFFIRTPKIDGGSNGIKKMGRVQVIGDIGTDTAMIRTSDDDKATNTAYRRVDLSYDQPMLRRLGDFRRRQIEYRHVGNTTQKLTALEIDVGGQ